MFECGDREDRPTQCLRAPRTPGSAAEFRHQVFTGPHLERPEGIMRAVCGDFEVDPAEFTGEGDHVRLQVGFPPKVTVSKLLNRTA